MDPPHSFAFSCKISALSHSWTSTKDICSCPGVFPWKEMGIESIQKPFLSPSTLPPTTPSVTDSTRWRVKFSLPTLRGLGVCFIFKSIPPKWEAPALAPPQGFIRVSGSVLQGLQPEQQCVRQQEALLTPQPQSPLCLSLSSEARQSTSSMVGLALTFPCLTGTSQSPPPRTPRQDALI